MLPEPDLSAGPIVSQVIERRCTCGDHCPNCGGTRQPVSYHVAVSGGPVDPDALRRAFAKLWMGEMRAVRTQATEGS